MSDSTAMRRSTGARARCCLSYPHHRRPLPPPSPCPLYPGSPVHSSASTTGSLTFACPYQTCGNINERSFFISHQNDCLSLHGPLCVFPSLLFLFFLPSLYLSFCFSYFLICYFDFSSFCIFLFINFVLYLLSILFNNFFFHYFISLLFFSNFLLSLLNFFLYFSTSVFAHF